MRAIRDLLVVVLAVSTAGSLLYMLPGEDTIITMLRPVAWLWRKINRY